MRRLILAGLVLAAAGCGKAEEVRRYKAPKDPLWRMVAAIASGKDQTWYFKAVGSDRLVGEYQGKLLSFLKGLRLEDGAVRWTLPPDVKEVPGQGDRQATLRFGAREPFLDVTVVTLAGTGGGTLANVNRWRGQMGLGAIGEADLPAHTRTISAQGLDVLALDLTSPRRPGGGMAAAAPPPQETGRDDLRSLFAFDTPPGWKENPHPGPGRIF